MRYILIGNPIPLARARISGGRCYDSQKQHKLAWGIELSMQHEGKPIYEKPLHLDAIFYFKKPEKQLYEFDAKFRRNKQYKPDGTPHATKPDLDNLVKFLCDVLTGILIKDDNIISSMKVEKVYGDQPRVEFDLWEI